MNKEVIIVGIIGKSNLPNCNKICFDLFKSHSIFLDEKGKEREENRIKFYYQRGSKHIFVHFETTFDSYIAYDFIKNSTFDSLVPFQTQLRTKFSYVLLFATQICHIVIMVETAPSFDASYLTIFKALKIIREKYVLKFLPKLLKNTSIGVLLGKDVRLCSPRFIFLFEKLARPIKDLTTYEIKMEDEIYQMLRSNFIITNNSSMSLFSLPRNKKFLYINVNEEINADPIVDSVEFLMHHIKDNEKEYENYDIRPYPGYGLNSNWQDAKSVTEENQRNFSKLLLEHVDEALISGFDDSIAKYRSKNHFIRPTMKVWFEIFKFMHKIFILNPNDATFEAKDTDYKAFLDNFHKIIDIDEQLFFDSSIYGFDHAIMNYNELLPAHYSSKFHESKLSAALEIFYKYARGPETEALEKRLRENAESIWLSRKQCEMLSLRGNACILALNHDLSEGTAHSSGVILISACNCGHSQGRREDPFTIKKANFDFYQIMMSSCSFCEKALVIDFPTFVPSSSNFKAAEMSNKNLMGLILSEYSNVKTTRVITNDEKKMSAHHLSASQKTQASECDLSLNIESDEDDGERNKCIKKVESDDEEMNEIIVKIGEVDIKEEHAIVSTTEYLPGMITVQSPVGLLPQFPSYSLLCIGNSSLYSHNTGLTEREQAGFLSGTNFLLAWDVKVRLEHAKTWAENFEKNRNRKKHINNKQTSLQNSNSSGTFFTLKIFVGMEYECMKGGHRFFCDSNHSVLRGSSGGSKACGSKVVFANMPIFFPCPCRQNSVAQLMRVHCVTPKAPVFITIDPKIRIRRESESNTFVTGWNEPAKLSPSSYWILRLPNIYQGDDGVTNIPPQEVPNSIEALRHGYLMEGMFGIKENESGEIS